MKDQQHECFQASTGSQAPSHGHKRIELQIIDRSGVEGTSSTESFDLSAWTPEQLAALRAFVAAPSLSGSSLVPIDDLKRISHRPSRIFHILHSVFGSEMIKRFYTKTTIRLYRQRLRDAGFDYPVRPVPTGPRQPRVVRDLSMGPSRVRRPAASFESTTGGVPSGGASGGI